MKSSTLFLTVFFCLLLISTTAFSDTSWTSHPNTTTDSRLVCKIGQGFTVYSSGDSLVSLIVYAGTNPLENATLNIYSGSNGTAGSLLATGATGISGEGMVTIYFSTPFPVEPGTYTWMLEQDSAFNLIVSTEGTGVFSGGNLVYDDTSVDFMDVKFDQFSEERNGSLLLMLPPLISAGHLHNQ